MERIVRMMEKIQSGNDGKDRKGLREDRKNDEKQEERK